MRGRYNKSQRGEESARVASTASEGGGPSAGLSGVGGVTTGGSGIGASFREW
jgi:hypothetical protein